ncbi:hypothetical protein P153DRAFT_336557 [Dothidotthia symphoricarpi CBS 119687]|uniref:Uncharacterized protein n=1 Tax=Dothidotthia symphoricarpi CBS 119687 TaxID=1392245 RepID=A0A6A6AJW8_9PLEO|nr:uncharacterized protein P153DRAFT_336557 [Dothidotthia symphoricarpi CBS 119687]KAF2130731.1 hypothetical protein P153DRAFT_336557 [Dothidotthia symphoricarpi CBS 119687]
MLLLPDPGNPFSGYLGEWPEAVGADITAPEEDESIFAHSWLPTSRSKRMGGFSKHLDIPISRPLNNDESWVAYSFEMHAEECVYCKNPYKVHRRHSKLCDHGFSLARDVARLMYNTSDGETYSTIESESGKGKKELVRIELPTALVEIRGLLKAVERSSRRRDRMPFVSTDKQYYVVSRAPQTSRPVRQIVSSSLDSESSTFDILPERNAKQESLHEGDYTKQHGTRGQNEAEAQNQPHRGLEESRFGIPNFPDLDQYLEHDLEFSGTNTEENDNISVVCSDNGSIFSVESQASSATDLSKVDANIETQIAFAVRKLLAPFQNNQMFSPPIHFKHDPLLTSFATFSNQLEEVGFAQLDFSSFGEVKLVTFFCANPTLDTSLFFKRAFKHKSFVELLKHFLEIHRSKRATLGGFQGRHGQKTINEIVSDWQANQRKHSTMNADIYNTSRVFTPKELEFRKEETDQVGEERLVELHEEEVTQNRDENNMPRIGGSRAPLQGGALFQSLFADSQYLTLRASIRNIIQSVPKRSIHISLSNDVSLTNTAKGFLEDYTGQEWDWWPLTSRLDDLQPGDRRLEWQFCGQTLFETISAEEAKIVQDVLETTPNHPAECYCCEDHEHQITWTAIFDCMNTYLSGLLQNRLPTTSSSGSKQSKAMQRYTPPGSSSASSSTQISQNLSQIPSNTTSGNGSTKSVQVQGNSTNSTIAPPPPVSNWVLFGVQGSRWSLELEHIGISNLINDPTFFSELKSRYKRHRGWTRFLLSPFRFRFCRFVKFEKFDANRILSHGEDLPDYHGFEHDYEYAPRPGKNPLINPKTFAVCLNACGASCIWPLLNPWHDCVKLPRRCDKLRCIPKKKSEFDVDSEDVEIVAWGLEADYALSFAFLAAYHLVPIFAALGFWVYWLWTHPGDLQNSSVPIFTVLALFAAFWMMFGKHLGMG